MSGRFTIKLQIRKNKASLCFLGMISKLVGEGSGRVCCFIEGYWSSLWLLY